MNGKALFELPKVPKWVKIIALVLVVCVGIGLSFPGPMRERLTGCGWGSDTAAGAVSSYIEAESSQSRGNACPYVQVGSGWSKEDPKVNTVHRRLFNANWEAHDTLLHYSIAPLPPGKDPDVDSSRMILVYDAETGEHLVSFAVVTTVFGKHVVAWDRTEVPHDTDAVKNKVKIKSPEK